MLNNRLFWITFQYSLNDTIAFPHSALFTLRKMNRKTSKSDTNCKKLFVRDSSVSVRPREVIEIIPSAPKITSDSEEIESEKSERFKDLRAPDFCTVLKLAGEIKKIREECYGKVLKDDIIKPRNVNFLPDEKLYEDLIDLNLNENPVGNKLKSHSSSRSITKKDPEPDFNKMLKYELQPEYVFSTSVAPELKKKESEFNGRSLYNHMKKWKS